MPRNGRPPSCECGACTRCMRNADARKRWARMTLEERRAVIASRDPARVRAHHVQAEQQRRKSGTEEQRAKVATRMKTRDAIKAGRLVRGPCEVPDCTERAECHHDDHSKPLDVRWFCRQHHIELHQARGDMVVLP